MLNLTVGFSKQEDPLLPLPPKLLVETPLADRRDVLFDAQDHLVRLSESPADVAIQPLVSSNVTKHNTVISAVKPATGVFSTRSAKGKAWALQTYGGSLETENAVALGLQWLHKIQRRNGSWNLGSPGRSAKKGDFHRSTVAATSLSLLCFLGAGHAHHKEGPYQKTILNGLKYIASSAKFSNGTTDLRGSCELKAGLYTHSMASICLCEAYALNPQNSDLKTLAQRAIRFIEISQNPSLGGWQYSPGIGSDTSVVGWHVLALKTAQQSGIAVSPNTLRQVRKYLDSVSRGESGSKYAYAVGGAESDAMTAVGLLSRINLGWDRSEPGLRMGAQHLSAVGPDHNDVYFNYYATQVMKQWGGPMWKEWNLKQRSMLIATQMKTGAAAGSWPPVGFWGKHGGQLCQTALNILTLEVYYRHESLLEDPAVRAPAPNAR